MDPSTQLNNSPDTTKTVRFSTQTSNSFASLIRGSLLSDATDIAASRDSSDCSSSSSDDSVESFDSHEKGKDKFVDDGNDNGKEIGAAGQAYEAIKNAWTWGHHETPLAPIFGIAEGLTSKTIGLFGTDLKGIDDSLKPHVAQLDQNVVKPTISKVMEILEGLNSQEQMKTAETQSIPNNKEPEAVKI